MQTFTRDVCVYGGSDESEACMVERAPRRCQDDKCTPSQKGGRESIVRL